jgi:hypothetical protein
MRAYYESNPNDRYAFQAHRQSKGLPCSDCGSHQGHFGVCPLFHKGLPTPVEIFDEQRVREIAERYNTWDKPQPDSQSFYRKAKAQANTVLPEDYTPVYSEYDRNFAYAMGVKL